MSRFIYGPLDGDNKTNPRLPQRGKKKLFKSYSNACIIWLLAGEKSG